MSCNCKPNKCSCRPLVHFKEVRGNDGYNGWTPIYEDTVYGDKIVRKLIDYIGGTGRKPTFGVGKYLTNGGYTTNIDLASNYKGEIGLPGPVGNQIDDDNISLDTTYSSEKIEDKLSKSALIPILEFTSSLLFDKNYKQQHIITGAINFILDNSEAPVWSNKHYLFLRANGINKPTFSEDFIIRWDNWNNANSVWNLITITWTPSGVGIVDIIYY